MITELEPTFSFEDKECSLINQFSVFPDENGRYAVGGVRYDISFTIIVPDAAR